MFDGWVTLYFCCVDGSSVVGLDNGSMLTDNHSYRFILVNTHNEKLTTAGVVGHLLL